MCVFLGYSHENEVLQHADIQMKPTNHIRENGIDTRDYMMCDFIYVEVYSSGNLICVQRVQGSSQPLRMKCLAWVHRGPQSTQLCCAVHLNGGCTALFSLNLPHHTLVCLCIQSKVCTRWKCFTCFNEHSLCRIIPCVGRRNVEKLKNGKY